MNESRRLGLEQYLMYVCVEFCCVRWIFELVCCCFRSAVQAVIDSGSDKAKTILAKFLDDEYSNLLVDDEYPCDDHQ
jgi:hypothetical protein